MYSGMITLHAWIYEIETGEVFAYDANISQFKVLKNRPFPVPNPLISIYPE
jgi:carbonic anhydrase